MLVGEEKSSHLFCGNEFQIIAANEENERK